MKQKMNFAQITRMALWVGLIFCTSFTFVRAQAPNGTVIPRGCVVGITNQNGTVNLAADIPAGVRSSTTVNEFVPVNSYIVINPGGANQQSGFRVSSVSGTVAPYTLGLNGAFNFSAHQAGEPVTFDLKEYEVSWGYQNLSAVSVTIQRGISTGNYFFPAPTVHAQQTSNFLPGIHDNVFSTKIASQLAAAVTWYLNGSTASAGYNQPAWCGTITYQGRLSDAGAAANGQYDLQFEAFDTATGGAAQSGLITLEDVQVTNGIFTVHLNFGSAFYNNFNARFLEIGVRAGTATGAFTVLTPRQPLTQVPFAVNAQTAFDVRLQLTINAPPSAECDETSEHGRMKADATNNRLYVCMTTGWKAFVPQ
jgi:hypothetical protein